MKHVILLFCIFYRLFVYSQNTDTLTLGFCHEEVFKNYPLIVQKKLIQNSAELKIKKLHTSLLPQLTANGQFTYQSDVTSIPQLLPIMTPITFDKDQYKLFADLSQIVYDGGTIAAMKKIESYNQSVEQKALDVELYKIKERINQLYFSIIYSGIVHDITELVRQNLNEKLRTVEAGIKNDLLLQSNADVIKAEILKLEQQLIDISSAKKSAVQMLAELMGKDISDAMFFEVPDIQINTILEIKRPELELFEMQKKKIDISDHLIDARLKPRINLFGQAGYGKPGLNMLSNSFDFFYYAGARISWNFSAFYQMKMDKEINTIQKDFINSQQETFEKNLKMSIQKEKEELFKFELLIEKDKEIIILLEKVTQTASKQFENGTLTATDYINELNKEKQAKLNKELHEIQLIMSKINYLFVSGGQ